MKNGFVSLVAVGLCLTVIGSAHAQLERFTAWPAKRAPMLQSLKDPTSARIERERAQGPYLCGTVNSKNSYGAYAGSARFVTFEEGYAINGSSLATWPAEHAPTKAVFELMSAKLRWMRASNMAIDYAEENRLAFEELWLLTCGAKQAKHDVDARIDRISPVR